MSHNPVVYISQFKYKVIRDLRAFHDYCQTFEFDLFCEKFVENPSITNLDSDTKVRQALIAHLEPLREELLTYKNDFNKFKSVEDIANNIGVSPERVKAYIERNKINFSKEQISGLSE